MSELTEEEKSIIEMYGCKESPLFYTLKQKCRIDFVDENYEVTIEDFNLDD